LYGFIVPTIALAQQAGERVCTDSQGRTILCNPLQGGDAQTVVGFLTLIFENLIPILIPFIVFAVVWAGFRMVLAQGNPGKLEDAKKGLIYTLIGSGIVLIAGALIQFLSNTIAGLLGQG